MSRTTSTHLDGVRGDRVPGPDHVGDGELWRRAVDGDPDSFGLLFDRHGDTIHGYCARRPR